MDRIHNGMPSDNVNYGILVISNIIRMRQGWVAFHKCSSMQEKTNTRNRWPTQRHNQGIELILKVHAQEGINIHKIYQEGDKVNTKYHTDHFKNKSAIVVSILLFCVKHKSTDG